MERINESFDGDERREGVAPELGYWGVDMEECDVRADWSEEFCLNREEWILGNVED